MNQYTQARWNGKLVSGGAKEVMSFADSRYSPAAGSNYLLKDCPLLAAICDPLSYRIHIERGIEYAPDSLSGQLGYTATAVGSSTITRTVGGLLFTTGATEDNGIQAQHCTLDWQVGTAKDMWCEFVVNLDEVLQSDFLLGIATSDTTVIASAPTNGIYFMKDDGDANIDVVTRAAGTETRTDSGIDIVNATDIRLGWHAVNNSRVDFYVNNVLVAQHSANIPSAALRFTMALLTGEAVAKAMVVRGFIMRPL